VHAVLGVDLQARVVALGAAHDLIHAGRAVALLGASYLARLMLMGTEASFSCRWQGSSSSWLVLERNTDDRRSKVSLPSGLG
jgi:hypothetical protein